MTCKIKADPGPALVDVAVNGRRQALTTGAADWNEATLQQVRLRKGVNRVLLRVKAGAVSVDWLSFQ